ncbi:U4/U6.U5 tri-snRNP-associated protein 1 [Dermatophagoides pteronyssinus]|uniref:U4/U6.U5 tri-snRNP-associated protein 1 n=1 Tax=Dermatophagoides pteronyssinus TaxID=6956 RepID=A0ABQ8J825_DERPT|nr:U4/U6.U5 tri-snRNP-associated protein 1 [Dermatophagoides pteronyssinus]
MSDPNEVFVKTENIKEKLEREKILERLETQREKRKLLEKYRKVKSLAHDDDDNRNESDEEDAAEWYQRTKHQHKEQKTKVTNDHEMPSPSKRTKTIDKRYTSSDLKGLAIGHKSDSIKEGQAVVLTLRDKDVLDEQEDVLENVNIVDDERAAKNVDNKQKRPEYRPYDDDEFEMEEFGNFNNNKKQSLLGKYDEEIEGQKNEMFRIGTTINTGNNQLGSFKTNADISTTTNSNGKISLNWNDLKIANEYYTPEEMAVKFKKPSKKKSSKNLRQKHSVTNQPANVISNVELVEPPRSKRSRRTNSTNVDSINEKKKIELNIDSIVDNDDDDDLIGPDEDLSGIVIDDEAENELQSVLHKARKIKLKEKISDQALAIAKIVETVKREMKPDEEDETTNQSSMDIDYYHTNDGVGGALKLAMTKGYLDKETAKSFGATCATSIIQAQSYTIEEKFYDDDRIGRRDRYSGSMQEFREKEGYHPDFKLDYVDEKGRMMNQKEAFRYLSHKFHGKGPGKNKIDKRMKKMEQESVCIFIYSNEWIINNEMLMEKK